MQMDNQELRIGRGQRASVTCCMHINRSWSDGWPAWQTVCSVVYWKKAPTAIPKLQHAYKTLKIKNRLHPLPADVELEVWDKGTAWKCRWNERCLWSTGGWREKKQRKGMRTRPIILPVRILQGLGPWVIRLIWRSLKERQAVSLKTGGRRRKCGGTGLGCTVVR